MKLINSSLVTTLSNWFTQRLIHRSIRRKRRQTSGDVPLDALWKHLYSNPLFRLAASRTISAFNLRNHDYVMFHCIKFLRTKNIMASPEFYWTNPEAIQQLAKKNTGAALIVTLHSGFAFTIRELSEAGRSVATISRNKTAAENRVFSNTRIDSPVTIIARDKYCLAHLRKAVLAQHILCCAVDFRDTATGRFNLISPTLFDFSIQMNLPVYYSQTSITSEGKAACTLTGPLAGNAAERLDKFMEHIRLLKPYAGYTIAAYAA